MDKRNSKESLLRHIECLEEKLLRVYYAGEEGIESVGQCNTLSRENDARSKLRQAMEK